LLVGRSSAWCADRPIQVKGPGQTLELDGADDLERYAIRARERRVDQRLAVAAATGQESFGYSVVEAMAAGVPVVATDIEGYRQVATDELDAVLVPPGDAVALASAIGRVLDDDDLAHRLAAAGRETAAAFDWDVVVERVEDVYRSVLAPPSLR